MLSIIPAGKAKPVQIHVVNKGFEAGLIIEIPVDLHIHDLNTILFGVLYLGRKTFRLRSKQRFQ